MDTVFHSILFLFARRERSCFSPLVNIELKAAWVELTSEGRSEFSLKTIWSQLLIVTNRFIRLLCASLHFVPINRLWKSCRNCPMKSPSIAWAWSCKLAGWSPGCNSKGLLGFSQVAVLIQCWAWPSPTSMWTSWCKSEKPGCWVWMTILNSSANLWGSSVTLETSLWLTVHL